MIASGLASLHELQTVYSLEDAYDMLEVRAVENRNQVVWDEFRERNR